MVRLRYFDSLETMGCGEYPALAYDRRSAQQLSVEKHLSLANFCLKLVIWTDLILTRSECALCYHIRYVPNVVVLISGDSQLQGCSVIFAK